MIHFAQGNVFSSLRRAHILPPYVSPRTTPAIYNTTLERTMQQEQPGENILQFPVTWHFFSSFGKGKMFTPWSDINFPKNYEVKLPSLRFWQWDCRSFQTFPTNHHSSRWAFRTLPQPTNLNYQPKNNSKRRTGGVTTARGLFHHMPEATPQKTRQHMMGPINK